MNLQLANFENLLATYYHGTAAHEATEHLGNLIRGEQQQRLATLLRDYRERAITSQEEIILRASTDLLMKCCSVMEIASLTHFIPELRQTEFGIELRCILENKYVRRYYEEYYPDKMPQLFWCRLAGTNRVSEKISPSDLNHTIMVFFDLDRRFMKTLDDGYLLRMLDSFTIQGYRFSDVIKLIDEPEKFINHLLFAPEDRDVMSRTLNEFSLFIQFCFDLRQLLARTEPYPLLQSEIWNHYSYWFDIIGDKLSRQLGKALSRFLEWKPVGGGKDAIDAVQDYVEEARTVLKILTSQQFAGPVDNLLSEIIAPMAIGSHVACKNAEEPKTIGRRLIQFSLDTLDYNQTIALAEIVAKSIDIFEIGTPCIKHNGVNLVKDLRARFPDKLLLVDLKIMDAGEYEATPFYAAGADICTVLGISGLATCKGVIKAANAFGAEAQIDLTYVEDKIAFALACVEAGAHILGVHTGLNSQTRAPLSDLNDIARLGLNVKISVAGGIKQSTVQDVVRGGANIIVVGAAIYGAPSPSDAAREIRELVDVA